jgi:hypothetical protein
MGASQRRQTTVYFCKQDHSSGQVVIVAHLLQYHHRVDQKIVI